jgi:hypothetical protein
MFLMPIAFLDRSVSYEGCMYQTFITDLLSPHFRRIFSSDRLLAGLLKESEALHDTFLGISSTFV